MKYSSYESVKKHFLKDKKVRAAYDALAPEYAVISLIIENRLKKGVTQAELARRMGTKQSAISRLERGTSNPSLQFLQKVAAALGVKLKISFS